MENEVGKKILDKISQDHIAPKPKWEFVVRDYALWLFFGASLLVGSLASGVIIHLVRRTNWPYVWPEDGNWLNRLLIGVPYFWLAMLLIFLVLAFYNFKHTQRGYRHGTAVVIAVGILISGLIGSLVYAIHGAEQIEETFYRRVPLYQMVIHRHGRMVMAHRQGLIPGLIVESGDDFLLIQDFNGMLWRVTTSTNQFSPGQRIYLIGHVASGQNFEADMIAAWFDRRVPPPPKGPLPFEINLKEIPR